MCYNEPDQHQCRCGTWTSSLPAVPRKPHNVCFRCFTKSLPSPLSVAVDRMTDAINREATAGAGEIMAVEAPLAILGPGGDYITEIKP